MSYPLISVVTPSFNQGDYLEQTILSVLNQRYSQIEYMVIDGGSTDQSLEVINKYKRHLTYWCSEKDNGQTEAINKGLARAKGDIVCWLNSDDLYSPDTIEIVADAFLKFPDDVIYGDYKLITSNGVPFLNRKEVPFDRDLLLYGVNFIGQPSSFMRRRVLEKYGFLDTTLRYAMDYEYWLRLAEGEATFRHIKKFLSYYRYHQSSKTVGSGNDFRAEMIKVRQKYSGGKSPSTIALRGISARIRRQIIKLRYRGTIDFLGGNLNRHWHRFAEAYSKGLKPKS